MEFDIKLGKQLIDELVDLWVETKIRCDKIEHLVKHIIEIRKIDSNFIKENTLQFTNNERIK